MALKASLAEAASALIGGGATGGSKSADPVAKGAVGLPNSKDQGEKQPIPAGTSVNSGLEPQDTPNETNVKPINANAGSNMSTIKTKPSAASSKMESIELIFAGTELSEESKEKMSTMIEATLAAKAEEIKTALQEEFDAKLEQALAESVEQLIDVTNDYLQKIAEDWVAENELAIESSIRTDIAESFMTGLKNLMLEHNIDIPEQKVDVVEELAARVAELEEQINSETAKTIELKNKLDLKLCEEILIAGTSDLTEMQKDKVKTLAEGVSFADPEDFKRKLTVIRENYIATVKTGNSELMTTDPVPLNEDTETQKASVDPIIANFAKNLGSTLKK